MKYYKSILCGIERSQVLEVQGEFKKKKIEGKM